MEMILSGEKWFKSFMPDGTRWAPGKKPGALASLNWPGNRPSNSERMNFACMGVGRKKLVGKRYQSLPKQTLSAPRIEAVFRCW